MAIRSTSKALLLHDGKVLLNQCVTGEGRIYYDLPGGGQRPFESLEEALQREVLEETGFKVSLVRLAGLCEEIRDGETLRAQYPEYAHRIFHIFLAELTDTQVQGKTEPDLEQVDSLWFSPQEADALPLRPLPLRGKVSQLLSSQLGYLGCAHITAAYDRRPSEGETP